MRILVRLITALILSALVVSLHAQAGQGQGTWSMKTGMGVARAEAGVVSVNGKIYMIGGRVKNPGAYALVQEYDPKTDKWTNRAPLPSPLSHPGTAVLNGKIYVVGGFIQDVHLYAQIYSYEYDPGKNSWRTLPWMKEARGAVGLAAVNGKLHAIGGRGLNGAVVDTHEIFDPATNKWTGAAPLPEARDHFATVVADGKIHVIGGRLASPVENTDLHSVFDPATNAWTSAPHLPEPRSATAGVLYHDRILVIGGECDNGHPFTQTDAYDTKTMQWSRMAGLPSGRQGIQAATDGQAVYLPGGGAMCGTMTSDTLMMFTLPVAATN